MLGNEFAGHSDFNSLIELLTGCYHGFALWVSSCRNSIINYGSKLVDKMLYGSQSILPEHDNNRNASADNAIVVIPSFPKEKSLRRRGNGIKPATAEKAVQGPGKSFA